MPRSQISLAKLESGPEGDRIRVEGPLLLEEEDAGMGGVPPESSVVLLTALATGLLVFVDRGKGGDVPIPQTFSWTEEVKIT